MEDRILDSASPLQLQFDAAPISQSRVESGLELVLSQISQGHGTKSRHESKVERNVNFIHHRASAALAARH